jgi:hypothetical protein
VDASPLCQRTRQNDARSLLQQTATYACSSDCRCSSTGAAGAHAMLASSGERTGCAFASATSAATTAARVGQFAKSAALPGHSSVVGVAHGAASCGSSYCAGDSQGFRCCICNNVPANCCLHLPRRCRYALHVTIGGKAFLTHYLQTLTHVTCTCAHVYTCWRTLCNCAAWVYATRPCMCTPASELSCEHLKLLKVW